MNRIDLAKYVGLLKGGMLVMEPVIECKGWHVLKDRQSGRSLYVCGRQVSKRLRRKAGLALAEDIRHAHA